MSAPALSARWKKRLHHASFSQSFLWKFALVAIFTGAAIGYALSLLNPAGPENFRARVLAHSGLPLEDPEGPRPNSRYLPQGHPEGVESEQAEMILATFAELLREPEVPFSEVLRLLPRLADLIPPGKDAVLGQVLRQRFSAEEAALGLAYLRAWEKRDAAAFAKLQSMAEASPPVRHAHQALGEIELQQEHFAAAAHHFLREGENPTARASRYLAVVALVKAKDFDRLKVLERDPGFSNFFTPYVQLQIAVAARNWPEIMRSVPRIQMAAFSWDILALTLLAGAAWSFFLAHLGEWRGPLTKVAILSFVGCVLGALSTTATLYAVIYQDDILGFTPGTEPLRVVLYYVAGVGLREELCKLLLFTPLLFLMRRNYDDFTAVIVASFVGLGFAIEENRTYFLMSDATSVPGRFLSANFFHIALTGLNGLALFRACRGGAAGINDFLFVFPLTVVAHGLYDAFLSLPELDNGFISSAIYIGFCTYYFHRVHELRENARMTISLTGSFVMAISVLSAVMIIFQMTKLGAAAGAKVMFLEIVGSAILLFMFFREFNEPLSR